ncbi:MULTISPECIES: hypothetical protein [Mesonia]|uniref:Uncharacterized protein n=1 Tax=Mesonia oceanica TaxID=2687242 RepID=A0AC61Y7Y2_9FLAO|nr:MULTISPECIES: hypothetical protein [Mesonia]MBJ97032.1 hypothetical protein [Flavobacteriaceae bacterium]MAN29490.1 hypothetical protein [Mesonia sp.]MAQ39469.1 hypothetical protein [Mesonia sp.]MAQ42144.1 hypothetical protein [Mesonia sp.]VVV00616.1 hypothetical protein FVB9532_01889 [Mesonia oceanica]|tara:strand:- start:1513 stop:1941 length:429 start_codon:yes stop_codon:yes gene_type:complete
MKNYTSNFQILEGPSHIVKDESSIQLEIPLPHDQFEVVSTYNLSSKDCYTLLVHVSDTSSSSKSTTYSEIAAFKKVHKIGFDDVLLAIDSLPPEGLQILVCNSPEMTASDINDITALIRKYSYIAFKHLSSKEKKGHGGILT